MNHKLIMSQENKHLQLSLFANAVDRDNYSESEEANSLNPKILRVFSDGASRGNPGPSGIGFVIKKNNQTSSVLSHGYLIHNTTNNVSEYVALLVALKTISKELSSFPYDKIEINADSELLIKQLKGEYKVKNGKLTPLFLEIRKTLSQLKKPFSFHHIPREHNQEADKNANRGIDKNIALAGWIHDIIYSLIPK